MSLTDLHVNKIKKKKQKVYEKQLVGFIYKWFEKNRCWHYRIKWNFKFKCLHTYRIKLVKKLYMVIFLNSER